MKLAEALIARADAQKRLAQLRSHISTSAKHQEGDDPSEDPNALIRDAEGAATELNVLIRRINRTNARTTFDGSRTLTDALADRDVLLLRRKLYAEAADAASPQANRFLRSELRMVSMLDVPQLHQHVDAISKAYRELDTRIQELNWATEVEE